jgi:quercetin dioxygenase-like cupin family protein
MVNKKGKHLRLSKIKEGIMLTKKSIEGQPFVKSSELEWETVDKGVQRKVLGYDDQLMMVYFHFEKGAVGTLHHHVHRQIAYVASGSFEVTIDGNKKTLEQGDCYFVAPDVVHGVLALEEGSLVDVFTPARKDFL